MERGISFSKLSCAALCIFVLLQLQQSVAGEECPSISAPVTFEKISNRLEVCGLQHIEELLPLLPAEYRSRYVLVYDSRSMQGASPQFPRVILFGLDAKLILAFAGHKELPGYELLETIEFDDSAKKFKFRSISFPADKPNNADAVKKVAVLSEQNPRKCMACHREELRPNWDTYSAWPGVYGSNDDLKPEAEERQYEQFLDQVLRKTGRYRFLEDAGQYPDRAWYYDYYRWNRPNLQFNWLLSLLNSQAIARSIRENATLYPYRYALLAALTCDDDFSDPVQVAKVIPAKITSRFSKPYKVISNEVVQSVEASYALRDQRQRNLLLTLGGPASDVLFARDEIGSTDSTSRIRYIMEGAGVSFPKWSMEFGSRHYVFYAGAVGQVGELGLYLWRELLDPVADVDIYRIYAQAWQDRNAPAGNMVFTAGTDELCGELRKKSLDSLTTRLFTDRND